MKNSFKILKYCEKESSRSNIKRVYLKWREEQQISYKCDNPTCRLHCNNPQWNNQRITMILDHINGFKFDNRTENLRLLCPNCNSQLQTHAGRNKGRIVLKTKNQFELRNFNGSTSTTFFGSAGLRIGVSSCYLT